MWFSRQATNLGSSSLLLQENLSLLYLIMERRQWLHLGPDRGFTLNIKARFPSAQPESDSVPFNVSTEKCGRTGEISVVFKY